MRTKTLIAVIAGLCCSGTVFAAAPNMNVPFSSHRVVIDGKVTNAEWQDAAVVYANRDSKGPAVSLLGGQAINPRPSTIAYLKYDNDALLVGVRCSENQPGYPKAYHRKPTDLLCDDDAVQVVLGIADENIVVRDVLNMGGYAGAMNQPVSSADHYYQFTTNAVGATARTYNESTLTKPLFTSAVSRKAGEWTLEMRIPFASAGISNPAGRTIFANIFRFRPPSMLGWYLPGFGGYIPMPFGTMVLLPSNRAGERTMESAPVVQVAESPSQPEVTGDIQWYPLAKCVASDITGKGPIDGMQATLRVKGIGERTVALNSKSRSRLILDLPEGTVLPQQAELTVTTKDGAQFLHKTQALQPVEIPAWKGTKAGEAYLKDRIPHPWTQPKVSLRQVKLCDKKISFGSNGLFTSVSDKLGEMLAGPAEVVIKANGRNIVLKPGSCAVTLDGTSARVNARQPFTGGEVETRSQVDYDGFTVVKLRVNGLKPQSIEQLSLRIPLRKENARFVHRMLVQDIRSLSGFGWEGCAGPVWLGGNDKGMAFSYDTDPFLSSIRRSQIQVIEKRGQTWLQFNFVDKAGQLTESSHIFRFFLQPTPTKPISLRKEGSVLDFVWEQYSDYEGYPDPSKTANLKKGADAAHANNRLFAIYTNQLLAENTPGFSTYRNDLEALPAQVMYRRAYDPGKDVPCFLCCKRGPEGELQLEGLSHFIKEAGIDGVFSDGMSCAWECDNPSHKDGCGRPVTVGWDSDEITQVVGQRQFLKRLRGIFDENGKPLYMSAHTGGGLDINTMSFFDGYLEGEQLGRYRPGYRLPLATAAIGYGGRPWGFRSKFWDNFYSRTGGMGATGWALAYSLINDTESNAQTAEERKVFNGFEDDSRVSFYPYWRPQPQIKRLAGDVLYSYYLKSDAAMLVISNLTWDDQKASLDIDKVFPGRKVTAIDLVTGDPVKISGGKLNLSIPSYQYSAFRIEPVAKSAVEQYMITTLDPKKWDLGLKEDGVPGNGVTVYKDFDMGDGPKAIKMTSTIWQSSATATLKSQKIGRDGTIRLKVRNSGRIRVDIGDASIYYDGSNGWRAENTENEGALLQPTVAGDKPQILELSLHNGLLDAAYGDQPLARKLKLKLGDLNTLKISTWAGDTLEFEVLEISSKPTNIAAVSAKAPAPNFKVSKLDFDQWTLNSAANGVTVDKSYDMGNGIKGVKMTSIIYQDAAIALFTGFKIGREGTISIRVQRSGALRIEIGNTGIFSDGGAWNVISTDRWNSGQIIQTTVPPTETQVLTLSLHDGVLDAVYGGQALARNLKLSLDDLNSIKLSTWAGYWFAFDVIEISSKPTSLFAKTVSHPVLQ